MTSRRQLPVRASAWLDGIAPSDDAATLRRLVSSAPNVAALLAGIAEGSPFLWELASREPARLAALLRADPDRWFSALLDGAVRDVAMARHDAEVMRILRRLKQEAALLIALADIGGVWEVTRVTRALTDLADTAVGCAVDHLLRRAADEGRLELRDRAQPGRGSGYFVLAMGKMGAFELNYSSDIDLMVFYDSALPALAAGVEPSTFHVRLTRALVRLLQERTADGYVFRVDLRLRPDPASTQIAISGRRSTTMRASGRTGSAPP
jgi:glutamate-ammonia-ligase adenylyltransferase